MDYLSVIIILRIYWPLQKGHWRNRVRMSLRLWVVVKEHENSQSHNHELAWCHDWQLSLCNLKRKQKIGSSRNVGRGGIWLQKRKNYYLAATERLTEDKHFSPFLCSGKCHPPATPISTVTIKGYDWFCSQKPINPQGRAEGRLRKSQQLNRQQMWMHTLTSGGLGHSGSITTLYFHPECLSARENILSARFLDSRRNCNPINFKRQSIGKEFLNY